MTDQPSERWTLEAEGQAARLLRRLAQAESEAERQPLFGALRSLSGQNLPDELRLWLNWFLEERLELRNAVGLLTGRADSGRPAAGLEDEPVFERAEYNWCALDRIRDPDNMRKLRQTYHDLETPLTVDQDGPFSFRRLTGAEEEDLAFFRGRSVSAALFAPTAGPRQLRLLKDYGKIMMMPLFPAATQRSGAVIYAAAICQALVRHRTKITSLSLTDLAESLPGLLDRPYLVDSYLDLFRAALECCR